MLIPHYVAVLVVPSDLMSLGLRNDRLKTERARKEQEAEKRDRQRELDRQALQVFSNTDIRDMPLLTISVQANDRDLLLQLIDRLFRLIDRLFRLIDRLLPAD